MPERLLRIRIRTVGQDTVQRAVRGITQGARQAAREQMQAERQVAREAQASARARERAATLAARQQIRAASEAARATAQADRTAARDSAREAQQLTQMRMRLWRQETQAQARAQRDQQRAAEQAQRRRARVIGAIGGAVIGGGQALLGRVQGYQSALGLPTRDALVTSYLDRQRSAIRLGHQAGLSSSDILERVNGTAMRTGVSQDALLQGLQYAQTTLASPDFNALDVFSRHLEEIADASYATGAPVEDLIGALGQMRNQFGITENDFADMIGAMVTMANEGSIEVGDLASNFTTEMGQFRNLRAGVSGVQAAREFAGTAEIIGQALPNRPEEAATQFRAVMSSLSRSRVQTGIEGELRRGGLSREQADVFDRNGRMTVSMPELISRMRQGHLDTPAALERAGIHNVRAIPGFQTLMHSMEGGSTQYQDIINSSSETGQAMIRDTNAELRASDAGRVDRERARAESNFSEHGAAVVDQMMSMATALTELETRFPTVTERMGMFGDVVAGSGVGGIIGGAIAGGGIMRMTASIGRLLGMGGVAAEGAAATGAAGTGSAAATTGAAALAVPAAALGAAGAVTLYASSAGDTVAHSAEHDRARAGLDEGARRELLAQSAALPSAQSADLRREVIARSSRGELLTRADIQEMARAIGGAVAGAIPTSTPSALGSAPEERRVARDRR